MSKAFRTGLYVLAAALLPGGPAALAQETESGVTLRGFVSQGYLRSSDNRYLDMDTDEGTFAFSEAAINVSAQPLPKLRVAAQLFARDLGPQGNNRLALDWGLGEYRAWDQLGFRFGRVKFPMGLYNTLADADVARPEILQPAGIYPPERRDLSNAIDGAGVFGTIGLGGAGTLEYEATVGTFDIDGSYLLARSAETTGHSLLPQLSRFGIANLSHTVAESSGHAHNAWGGFVEWSPPVSGLRLRTSLLGVSADLQTVSAVSGFAGPAPVALAVRTDFAMKIPHQLILSAEYRRGGLRVALEHARLDFERRIAVTGLPVPVPVVNGLSRPVATYGQIAYRFHEKFQASGYYSVNYSDRDDKEGAGLARRGEPSHGAYLKDLAFSVRSDVTPHWLVKAEVHRFDGSTNLSEAENPGGIDGKWTLFAVKTTLHF